MRKPIGQWTRKPISTIGQWRGTFMYSLPEPCDNVMALVHAHRFEKAANVVVEEVYNYPNYVKMLFRLKRWKRFKIGQKRGVMRVL